MTKTTLIIATYNWPEALNLVLKSLLNQSVFPDEVIIADDGSTNATKELIERFKNDINIPLLHLWQEDKGFQKAQILNKAIVKASGDYIIQIDGDCIMQKHFVKNHVSNAKKGLYLYGARVAIKKDFLEDLFTKQIIALTPFSKGIKKRMRAHYNPLLASFNKPHDNYSSKYRGCNASFWKADVIAVNGYNEDFTGWGREDSELVLRMHNNGIKAKRLKHEGIVFHIYHEEKSRDRFEINDSIEQDTIKNHKIWTQNGLDKYLVN